MHPVRAALLVIAASAALTGCKFVETAELQAKAAQASAATPQNADDWEARVVPHFQSSAVPVATLRSALADKGLDGAGAQYGHREGGEGTPFTYVANVSGKIVDANTQSRAATASVDTDGDGTADVTLQLGPVIRGTAIRDALPFISFTDYENQIEFARLAKAFNADAYEKVLEAIPREDLVGKTVTALGAVTVRKADETFLVTPVSVDLAP